MRRLYDYEEKVINEEIQKRFGCMYKVIGGTIEQTDEGDTIYHLSIDRLYSNMGVEKKIGDAIKKITNATQVYNLGKRIA